MEHVEHLLGAYHDGELPERARTRVEAHLRECARCRAGLSRLQALSRTLSAYSVPDLDRGAQRFRAQVALRLQRRRPAESALSAWWYLVPVALSGAMASLLALFVLPGLLRGAGIVLQWVGVDPGVLLNLQVDIQLSTGALALLRGMGTLAWEAALYSVLLLLFASYAGWVGVLWRTKAQPRSGKER